MSPWSRVVQFLMDAIEQVGAWTGGGTVVGIVLITFFMRAALIPVMAPLAERTRRRQAIVRRIKPQIKALDREFRDDPGTLGRRLKELHRENGIEVVDWPALGTALIQLPILIAMFQAVLGLWEAQALTVTGGVLGVVAAVLAALGTKLGGQSDGAPWMLVLSGVLPIAICLWLGPGIGWYLIGFYGAALLQVVVAPPGAPPDAPADG